MKSIDSNPILFNPKFMGRLSLSAKTAALLLSVIIPARFLRKGNVMESIERKNENHDFEKELAIDKIAGELRKADGQLVIDLSDEFVDTCLYDREMLIEGCIAGIQSKLRHLRWEEERAQTWQARREYRNKLQGQKKLALILKEIKAVFGSYVPSFQREIIQLAIEGQKPAENWQHSNSTKEYCLGNLETVLDGCDIPFRNKICLAYMTDILPELEAEYDAEEAERIATDELLNLTNGKTAEQIRSMIKAIETSGIIEKVTK